MKEDHCRTGPVHHTVAGRIDREEGLEEHHTALVAVQEEGHQRTEEGGHQTTAMGDVPWAGQGEHRIRHAVVGKVSDLEEDRVVRHRVVVVAGTEVGLEEGIVGRSLAGEDSRRNSSCITQDSDCSLRW